MKELLGQNGTSGWGEGGGDRTAVNVLYSLVCLWELPQTESWEKTE